MFISWNPRMALAMVLVLTGIGFTPGPVRAVCPPWICPSPTQPPVGGIGLCNTTNCGSSCGSSPDLGRICAVVNGSVTLTTCFEWLGCLPPPIPLCETACFDRLGLGGGTWICDSETACFDDGLVTDCLAFGLASGVCAASQTFCDRLLATLDLAISHVSGASATECPADVTGPDVQLEREICLSGEYQRYLSFLHNWRNEVSAPFCENPVRSWDDYRNEAVTSNRTVFVVHQGLRSDDDGALSNVGGVNRVLAEMLPGDPLYVMTDADDLVGNPLVSVTGQLESTAVLDFQGQTLTVIGGNFDASIPSAVNKVVNNLDPTSGHSLDLLFPMDAIYDNIYGLSLQQMADSVERYSPESSAFPDYVKAVVESRYADSVGATVSLFIQNCGSDPQAEPVATWPGNPGNSVTVSYRLQGRCLDTCGGDWTLEPIFGGGLAVTSAGTVSAADSCDISWGDAVPVGLPGHDLVCRHTRFERGSGSLLVWWPIGTGICPSKAMLYWPGNTTYDGKQLQNVYDVSIDHGEGQ